MIIKLKIFLVFFCEFAEPYQILFQDPATPMMNGIIDLHHYIFMFLITILIFVLFMLFFIVMNFLYKYEVLLLANYENRRRPFNEPPTKVSNYIKKWFFYYFYKKALFYNSNDAKNESFIKNKAKFFTRKTTSSNFLIRMATKFHRKITVITYWNSFWSSMNIATKGYATYTKRYRFQDNILLTPPYWIVLNWAIPTNSIIFDKSSKFNVGLVESTIDNTKSENNIPSHLNLRTETAFLMALFLKIFNYNKPFSFISVSNSKQIFGRRYVPKASRKQFIRYILSYTAQEFAAIFNPYIINSLYWIQVYSSVKSGLYKFTHNTTIEIVWTIIPSLVLVFIGIPSFILLYAMDEIIQPDFIIKCIGHQWYWSYEVEYPDAIKTQTKLNFEAFTTNSGETENVNEYFQSFFKENDTDWNQIAPELKKITSFIENIKDSSLPEYETYYNFSSYMLNEGDLNIGDLRLLEVDNPLYIPEKTHIDLLITANDVLHSWTIPSFGIKCDAVPGRLNHANLFVERTGIFYGQCSEICGVNHGFMPIKMVVENYEKFIQRMDNN